MDDTSIAGAEIGEANASSLATLQPGDNHKPSVLDKSLHVGASGWELALVTAPSSNDSHVTESKLAGGFDKFLLDSLYDNANIGRQQNVEGYNDCIGPNPVGVQATSNAFTAAPNVQMAAMAQQQIYSEQQQQNAQTIPLSSPQFSQPPVEIGPANPLGNPPACVPQNTPSQGSMNML